MLDWAVMPPNTDKFRTVLFLIYQYLDAWLGFEATKYW